MQNTKIQWATSTFNPWIGCTKISPGCAHCYAEHSTPTRTKQIKWGKGQPRSRTSEAYWKQPLRWNASASAASQRPRIFPSLMDWLDDEVPIEWLADFLKLIHDTPHLDWLLLTKRPENFDKRLHGAGVHFWNTPHTQSEFDFVTAWLEAKSPPSNVWLGTSVEDQPRADQRIPALLEIPARIRFLSVEPLLGPISFRTPADFVLSNGETGIHWVIVGGESGSHARQCHIQWIRNLVVQCASAKVPCFVKQLGADPRDGSLCCHGCKHDGPHPLTLSHPKGGDPAEWPPDLRVRQFPTKL